MKKIIACLVVLYSLLLFVNGYQITKYPVSLSMDEVATAFNAYSVLKTGRGEHGAFLPLAFKSVGDYKPPVHEYLLVPFYAILGINEFSTRLPIVLFASLTPIVFVLLLKKFKFSWPASFLGGVFLGFSPWHIHFVRGNFVAILAVLFIVLGTYFFVWWIEKKKAIRLVLSVVFFSLSVWSYHAERLFVPLLVVGLILIYKKHFNFKKPEIKKSILWSLAILAVFVIPFIYLAISSPAIRERAISTSIFRDPSLINTFHKNGYKSLGEMVFNNDIFLTSRHWLGKYLNYFDLKFWFWKGMQFTPPGYPDLGLFYATDLIIFLFGLYFFARSKDKVLNKVTLLWFFLGPISASIAQNEQHPLRALTWLPFFGIVAAGGFEYLLKRLKKTHVILVYVVFLFVNLIYFSDIYTKQFPRIYSEFWQYGFKQVALYACENKDNYDKIVISDTFGSEGPINTGEPYLYILFYCDWDRETYIKTGNHSDKLLFRRPREDGDMQNNKYLLIGSPWDFLKYPTLERDTVNEVDFLNGAKAFLMVHPK